MRPFGMAGRLCYHLQVMGKPRKGDIHGAAAPAKAPGRGPGKDVFLYLPAKVVEGVIGSLAIMVLMRLFDPEVYGRYGIINTTVNVSNVVLLGWLIQSAHRYAVKFRSGRGKRAFCATIAAGWAAVNVPVIAVAAVSAPMVLSGGGPQGLATLLAAVWMFVAY
ncbi:MAG: hypothetical protein FWE70_07535, partial [Oscillospiraceae bacterium]|nr:hypothetical protein [Oscillospiraceae bacterium]